MLADYSERWLKCGQCSRRGFLAIYLSLPKHCTIALATADMRVSAHQVSVSAVLNMGWKKGGHKWIKKGDFLTDTQFTINYTPGIVDYEKNIHLVKYD